MEIKILSQNYIKSEEIISTLKQERINVVVHNVEVMNNWEYENVASIGHKDSDIKKQVEDGKICTLEAILDGKYRAGIMQYQEGGMYCIDLWIDTFRLLFLDSDEINETNSSFYKEVTEIALKNQHSWQWKCIAIGVETHMNYRTTLQEMIYSSKNVAGWILVKGVIDDLEGYNMQVIDNIQVFSQL